MSIVLSFNTTQEINEMIPNRYPLMILDTLEVEPMMKAVGYKELKSDDWYFACHYPGNPIFPGCLLIETLTQVFISTFYSFLNGEIPILAKLGG